MKRTLIFILLLVIAGGILGVVKYFSQRKTDFQAATAHQPKIPFQKLIKESETVKVPILIYHYVEYVKDEGDTIRKSLNITPNIFEKQIQTLLDNSYSFIFIDELADYLDGKVKLAPKPIILTFDDGYEDFYTVVLPILTKHNVKATVYIVPGFLDKLNAMTSKQIQEVANSGLVEIASHTVHHINLKYESAKIAEAEIIDSKNKLEQLIAKRVNNFAYPYGGFNEETIKLLKEAGYRTAVTDTNGSYQSEVNRYYLYRLRPGAKTGKELIDWLESLEK
ncbi:MAG: polysaccharide deacetylase family protein [Candidatus Beckwithbacteria bacterium]|nr:polysaccharide deacetylase family protein [Candidatus Beckwithbacteria bacterium]